MIWNLYLNSKSSKPNKENNGNQSIKIIFYFSHIPILRFFPEKKRFI